MSFFSCGEGILFTVIKYSTIYTQNTPEFVISFLRWIFSSLFVSLFNCDAMRNNELLKKTFHFVVLFKWLQHCFVLWRGAHSTNHKNWMISSWPYHLYLYRPLHSSTLPMCAALYSTNTRSTRMIHLCEHSSSTCKKKIWCFFILHAVLLVYYVLFWYQIISNFREFSILICNPFAWNSRTFFCSNATENVSHFNLIPLIFRFSLFRPLYFTHVLVLQNHLYSCKRDRSNSQTEKKYAENIQ